MLDGHGVMICGPSGAGKSLLALLLIDDWVLQGRDASLVADDRIDLLAVEDALIMRAPPAIAGLIELRGRGVISRPFIPEAHVELVVELVDTLERMPEEGAFFTSIDGIILARAPVPKLGIVGVHHQILLIREALHSLAPPEPVRQQKTT